MHRRVAGMEGGRLCPTLLLAGDRGDMREIPPPFIFALSVSSSSARASRRWSAFPSLADCIVSRPALHRYILTRESGAGPFLPFPPFRS